MGRNCIKRQFYSVNRNGMGLLLLLLAVAIGVLIYFFGVYPEKRASSRLQEQSPDQYPWVEEWRIKRLGLRPPAEHQEKELSEEQPHITEFMQFEGDAKEEKDFFGEVKFTVGDDGTVAGAWGGDFDTTKKMNYVISSAFEGNTDPSKIYQDQEGKQDPSKLFMIAKGTFRELVTNYQTNKVSHGDGKIYVVGWINKDLKAEGRIHLTVDKKTQRIYQWSGRPGRGTGTQGLPITPFGL